MNFLIFAGVVALTLFVLSYLRTGRFGYTVLAFGAGYLLANLWSSTLASYMNVTVTPLSSRDIVYGLMILLPGITALLLGHKLGSALPRIVQALILAALGVALLLPILGIGSSGYQLYALVKQYRDIIISVILVIGLADMVVSRSSKMPKRHKEH